jgi:hypothetical protein
MRNPYVPAEGTELSVTIRCLAVLLTGAVLIALNVDAVQSASVDLAHHFALVERLSEKWWRTNAADWQSLGEMIIYPSASHRVAAVTGRILGSSFIGMQVVALAGLVAVWASTAWVMGRQPLPAAAVSLVTAAVGVFSGSVLLGIPFHGGELVQNYFFAQLVGQGVAAALLACWIALDGRADIRWGAALLLTFAPALTAGFHLLPALELLAFFYCVTLFDTVFEKDGRIRRLRLRVPLLLLATLLVLILPSTRAMVTIAANNGEISFPYVTDIPLAAAVASLLLLGLAAANLLLWLRLSPGDRRAFGAVKHLALFGGGIALLCLLQVSLYVAGFSNVYSVGKFGFALTSGVLVLAATVVGQLAFRQIRSWQPRFWQARSWPDAAGDRAVGFVCLLAFLSLSVTATLSAGGPASKVMTTAQIATLEQQVKALRDTRLPWSASGFPFVAGLQGLPPVVPYLLSIGVLNSPREPTALNLVMGQELVEPEKISFLITSRGAKSYDIPDCRIYTAASGLVLIDGTCFARTSFRMNTCEGDFDFTWTESRGSLRRMLIGFSKPEPAGRWIDGLSATFLCQSLEGRPAAKVRLDIFPFLFPPGGLVSQRLIVRINGEIADQRTLIKPEPVSLLLPLGVLATPSVTITLETPDAVTPLSVGLNGDGRRLGIGVRRISFE